MARLSYRIKFPLGGMGAKSAQLAPLAYPPPGNFSQSSQTYPDNVDFSTFVSADGSPDLDPNWIPIPGARSRAEMIARRWISELGEYHNRNLGVGISQYSNVGWTLAIKSDLQNKLRMQALQVEGVNDIAVSVNNDSTGKVTIVGNFTLATSQTWEFVFTLSSSGLAEITLLGPSE